MAEVPDEEERSRLLGGLPSEFVPVLLPGGTSPGDAVDLVGAVVGVREINDPGRREAVIRTRLADQADEEVSWLPQMISEPWALCVVTAAAVFGQCGPDIVAEQAARLLPFLSDTEATRECVPTVLKRFGVRTATVHPSGRSPTNLVVFARSQWPDAIVRKLWRSPAVREGFRTWLQSVEGACPPVWRAAIRMAQMGSDMDRLFAVWLAEHWIRRVINRISLHCRVSGEDLEAEMVTTVLEGVLDADPETSRAGDVLLKAAARVARRHATAWIRERVVPTLPERVEDRERASRSEECPPWLLDGDFPPQENGLAAPNRHAASVTQRESVRLGMLAGRLGLIDVVRGARGRGEDRQSGRVSLRPVEGGR